MWGWEECRGGDVQGYGVQLAARGRVVRGARRSDCVGGGLSVGGKRPAEPRFRGEHGGMRATCEGLNRANWHSLTRKSPPNRNWHSYAKVSRGRGRGRRLRAGVGSRLRGSDVDPGATGARGLRPVVALPRRLDSRHAGNDGSERSAYPRARSKSAMASSLRRVRPMSSRPCTRFSLRKGSISKEAEKPWASRTSCASKSTVTS